MQGPSAIWLWRQQDLAPSQILLSSALSPSSWSSGFLFQACRLSHLYLYTLLSCPGGFSSPLHPVVAWGRTGFAEPSNTHPSPPGRCLRPPDLKQAQDRLVRCPKTTSVTWLERLNWEMGPLWDAESAHALLLHGLPELKARQLLSMVLPTGTDQSLSDSAAKTIPPKSRLLAGKASFLTENHQQLSASNIQIQVWFTDIVEKLTKLTTITAICSWHFPCLLWVSLMAPLISQGSELLFGQWLNTSLHSAEYQGKEKPYGIKSFFVYGPCCP